MKLLQEKRKFNYLLLFSVFLIVILLIIFLKINA